jgi:RNA polymerase sigma-70 factor (ECF subfamily)
MESEITLIEQAAGGDIDAFEDLFQAHFQAVYNYALNLGGDPALAEDLTQETFIRAHRSLVHFGHPWKFRPWLFQITRNLLQDYDRRQHELPELGDATALVRDPSPGPEQTLLSSERNARIRTALHRLPEQHREALILRELEGLSYADIAAAMGISSQYVRVLIHRARAKFQESYTIRLLSEEPLPACPVLAERLDALHDGEPFSEEEDRLIREHLRTCRICQQRQRELVALSTLLAVALPVPPPAALEGQVRNRLRTPRNAARPVPKALLAGGLVIGTLVVAFFGWIVWRGLAAPAGPLTASSTLTAAPGASATLPSTSNALFYTLTLPAGIQFVPAAIGTATLTPLAPLQPNLPLLPPTLTFTPKPPTLVPDTSGPSITKVGSAPGMIYASGSGSCSPLTTVISASISDPSGIQRAVVIFAHTSFGSVSMSNVSGSLWRATLGPFSGAGDGTVDYQIRAFDNFNNRSDTGFKTLAILACLK